MGEEAMTVPKTIRHRGLVLRHREDLFGDIWETGARAAVDVSVRKVAEADWRALVRAAGMHIRKASRPGLAIDRAIRAAAKSAERRLRADLRTRKRLAKVLETKP
jgi:hypothetical protein